MPFRQAELHVAACTRCGAPIDKRSVALSKRTGERICRACDAAEETSERSPVTGRGTALAALGIGIFAVGFAFTPFTLGGHPVGHWVSLPLGVLAVMLGAVARVRLADLAPTSMRAPKGRSAGAVAVAAIGLGVGAILLFVAFAA